jgi:hypothetical protein
MREEAPDMNWVNHEPFHSETTVTHQSGLQGGFIIL